MTYTADSPILGQGTASAEAIQAWFAKLGPDYARFAPDGQYKPAPAGIGQSMVSVSRDWGVNSDLVAAQCLHESAAWQSRIVRDKNNPSGLGAVNDNAYLGAVTFPTPHAGIRATVAHLLSYAVGDGEWSQYDPRYGAVSAAGYLGIAPTLRGLNGRWAYPGTTYGQSIAVLANRLVDFAENGSWGDDMTGDRAAMLRLMDERYPLKIRVSHIPASNSNRPGTPAIPAGWAWWTIHETNNTSVGANAEMHRKFTHNGGGANPAEGNDGVSFTWVVDDEEAINLLPLNPPEKSWQASDGANGLGNSSESVETCENADGDFAKARENVARLVARRTIEDAAKSPDRIAQHNTWARDKKDCPNNMRANGGALWNELLARIRFILTDVGYFGGTVEPTPEPPVDDAWYLTLPDGSKSKFAYRLGFRGVIEGLCISRYAADPNSACLALFGVPREDEFVAEDGNTYQRTTKVTLQYVPGNSVPWDVSFLSRGAKPPKKKDVA